MPRARSRAPRRHFPQPSAWEKAAAPGGRSRRRSIVRSETKAGRPESTFQRSGFPRRRSCERASICPRRWDPPRPGSRLAQCRDRVRSTRPCFHTASSGREAQCRRRRRSCAALAQIGEEQIERHRDDRDGAEKNLLNMRPWRKQREADLKLGEKQGAAERSDDRSLAPAEARAADDDGGEDGEGLRQADVRLARLNEREIENACDRGEDRAEDEGRDFVALDRQARQLCGLGIAANRHEAETEQRAVKEKADHDGDAQHPENFDGQLIFPEALGQSDEEIELALRQILARRRIVRIEGAGIADPERQAIEEIVAAERYDEGRDLEAGDEKAVE